MLEHTVDFLLFDMDGTLLRLGWGAAGLATLREEIRQLLRERRLRPPFGMLIPALAELGRDEPPVARLLAELERCAAEEARACAGVPEVLAALPFPLALVTSNGRACVERALAVAGLGPDRFRFDAIVSRDDVRRMKPDPEPFRRAAELLQVRHGPPRRLYVLGDSATDLEAGRALRAEVSYPVVLVGVLGGVSDREQLRAAGADAVLDSLRAFPAAAPPGPL